MKYKYRSGRRPGRPRGRNGKGRRSKGGALLSILRSQLTKIGPKKKRGGKKKKGRGKKKKKKKKKSSSSTLQSNNKEKPRGKKEKKPKKGKKKKNYERMLAVCQAIKNMPESDVSSIVPTLKNQNLNSIYDTIRVIINNKNLKKCDIGKLRKNCGKNKSNLRFLGNKKNPCKKKREILQSMGSGVLTTIAGVAIPLLLSLISKWKRK